MELFMPVVCLARELNAISMPLALPMAIFDGTLPLIPWIDPLDGLRLPSVAMELFMWTGIILCAVDPIGTAQWVFIPSGTVDDFSYSAPTIAGDGTIYVAANDQTLLRNLQWFPRTGQEFVADVHA